ncbi:hypothetical protein [Shahe hepe-like virus 1]|uniref:hypothetical protein n=1 Tax=Shahe hepe-like virus 1 TaxID=1923415 RepID=UPI00090BFFAA|nr:hypothetical protein [Shahe hepe-like virus 1]APG77713.1 hypothetical protein [Shahe hepe-like virus 1]
MNRGTTYNISSTSLASLAKLFDKLGDSIYQDFTLLTGFLLPYLLSFSRNLIQIIQIFSSVYLVLLSIQVILQTFSNQTNQNFKMINSTIQEANKNETFQIKNQTDYLIIYGNRNIVNQTDETLKFLNEAFEQVTELLDKIEVNTKNLKTEINAHTTEEVSSVKTTLTSITAELTVIEACACSPIV